MARGDHLAVKRWKGFYTHHGIDLGDGTVVHFSGEPFQPRDAAVVRDTLEVFCGGHEPRVVRYASPFREVEEIVATALSHVGQTGYALWTNNCEHFATYCVTGRRKSKQVRKAAQVAAIATLSTGLAMGIALARRNRRPLA